MSSEENNNKSSLEKFPQLVGKAAESFFPFHNYWSGDNFYSSKKLFGMLIQELQALESFLDDHGARLNKQWFYFSEIVASMRNLGIVAFLLHHIFHRYEHYKVSEIESGKTTFIEETKETLEFINQSIKKLFSVCVEEAKRNKVPINESVHPKRNYEDVLPGNKLPADYEFEVVKGEKERILSLARKVRKAAKMFREERFGQKFSPDELMELVPLKINEKKARKFKTIIHGVQSDYDTYVKNTSMEKGNSNLNELRRATSVPLHLLEAARWLSHFYERHERSSNPNSASEKIAGLVDKGIVLDKIVNFCFYHSNYYLQKGNGLAESIMSAYIEKVQYELTIPTPLGFHARPATYVSLIVNEHGTDVELIVDDQRFNAKSVINLLMAAGLIAEKGYEKVIFEGDKEVLDDLKILAQHNYCENNQIPTELSYLRILRNMPRV